MSRILYLAIALLVAVIGLAFHVRNQQPVVLDYFAGKVNVELSLVLVGALVLGVGLGLLAMLSSMLGLRRELRRQQRRHQIASRELASLRSVSLQDVS